MDDLVKRTFLGIVVSAAFSGACSKKCYQQAKTSAAVKACNIAEGSALDEFVWAAASLDPTADSLCGAK
jgi:hypothetical protein